MLDLIYCAAGNPALVEIAREEGWLLGMRSDASPMRYPPVFVDIDYKQADFMRHLEMVKRYRPKYATIPDLSEQVLSEEDITRAIKQAEQVRPYCEVVLIVPKLPEQIALIPPDIAIGYSVPSRYGGATYPIWELAGRQIHLLGGSPRKQMQAFLHLSAIGEVTSADGNYAQAQAVKYAMYWQKHQWHYHPLKEQGGKNLYVECWRWSCKNLMQAWKSLS